MNDIDSDAVKITIQLTLAEQHRAALWFYLKNRWWVILCAVLLYPLIIYLNSSVKSESWLFRLLYLLPLFPLAMFCYSVFYSAKMARQASETPQDYLFSFFGVYHRAYKRKTEWANFSLAAETKKDFWLWQIERNEHFTLLIPKRLFSNITEINAFRQLLKSQLGVKARLKA